MRMMTPVALALVLSAGIGTTVRTAAPRVGTAVGEAFPGWLLPSLSDGRPLSLADFRGTKVVLHQFASW